MTREIIRISVADIMAYFNVLITMDSHALIRMITSSAQQMVAISLLIVLVHGELLANVSTLLLIMQTKNAAITTLKEKLKTMVTHAHFLMHTCNARRQPVRSLWIAQARGRNMALASTKQTPTRTGAADCIRCQRSPCTTGMLAPTRMTTSSARVRSVCSQWTAWVHGTHTMSATTLTQTTRMRDAACTG